MNYKMEAAFKAASLVTDKSTIGLGAGSTIAYLLEYLQKSVQNGLKLHFVTS